jgi:predicted nucleic acid-binding protein
MKRIVLDTPVLIKFFTKEKNSELARKLLDLYLLEKIDIYISELSIMEAIHILSKYNSYKELIELYPDLVFDYGFHIETIDRDIFKKSVEIMIDNDISIFAAINLGLSKMINGVLITTDRTLRDRLGDKFEIQVLDEFMKEEIKE